MRHTVHRCDIAVVGGGPAGSTLATSLARLGYDVCLVEAAANPGSQIAASLGPDCISLLDHLGAGDALAEAKFIEAVRPRVRWDGEEHAALSPWGLHVERGRFDQLLITHAAATGVRVFQPFRASRPEETSQGWRIDLASPGEAATLDCRFWADATGRRSALGGRHRLSAPTVALTARWATQRDIAGQGQLASGGAEWLWCAPVTSHEAVAMAVVSPARLHGLTLTGVADLHSTLIKASATIGPLLVDKPSGPVAICDAAMSASRTLAGPGFIRVGDAALAIDPLSSQGIKAGIASALQAAAVVNTMFRSPQEAGLAIDFYQARANERAALHRDAAAEQYRRLASHNGDPFWSDRSGDQRCSSPRAKPARLNTDQPVWELPVAIADAVRFEQTAAIANDRIVVQEAIAAPTLGRAVAYVGTVGVAELLHRTVFPVEASALVQRWAATLGYNHAHALFDWLWTRSIIRQVDSGGAIVAPLSRPDVLAGFNEGAVDNALSVRRSRHATVPLLSNSI